MAYKYGDPFHMRRNIIILVALVLLLVIAGLAFTGRLTAVGNLVGAGAQNEQDVLDKLLKHAEMQDYSGWQAEVVYLSSQDVKELARKQPVVYGDVSGDVYRVTLTSGSRSVLVLYDYDNDVIVKQFEVLNVQLA